VSWQAHAWAKKQTALPRKAFALLRHLANDANDEGICWPDQNKLASYTVWSKGTIKRWTDFLRVLGLISTKKRFNHRKGHCDAMIYTVHLDRLVTPEEVEEAQRQIAKPRFGSGEGKSQPAANSKSQPAANISHDPQVMNPLPLASEGNEEARPRPREAPASAPDEHEQAAATSRARGTNPRTRATNPRANGTNPRATAAPDHEARHSRAVAPPVRNDGHQPKEKPTMNHDDKLAALRARFSKWQIERWRRKLREAGISAGNIDDLIVGAADYASRNLAADAASEDFKIELTLAVMVAGRMRDAEGNLTTDVQRLRRMLHSSDKQG